MVTVQPAYGLVLIAESDIRQGDIGIEGGILIMPTFQVLDYLNGFFSPSGDRVSIAEVGVECPRCAPEISIAL